MALWGESGEQVTWGFDPSGAKVGSRLDLVFDIITSDGDSGSALVFTWPGHVKARIFSGLGRLAEDVTCISVYGVLYADHVGLPGFVVDKHSVVLDHPSLLRSDLYNVIEMCAGMGVCTQGLQEAGLQTVVANELRQPMAEAFQKLHPDIHMVVGDVCDPFTVVEIHNRHRRSALVMAGFSCQPFSSGGQQQGYLDGRSNTLLGVLRGAVMLRSPIIMLECVKDAGTNRYVRRVIESFRDEFQFSLNEGILRLEDCWVSKRERWWAILAAPPLGQIKLPPLPCLPFPSKLRHVLPVPFPCSDDEMVELLLSDDEMRKLIEANPAFTNMYLALNCKAPTCLHAWGSQFSSCPCGCRLPFSKQTLKDKGVYGVFVPTGDSFELDGVEQPLLRHLHPTEVGWANGVLAPPQWPEPLRLSLAGLGQMASPIHSLWVASQVVYHLGMLHSGASDVSGSQCLDRFMKKLFGQIQTQNGTLGPDGNVPSPAGGFLQPSEFGPDETLVPPDEPMECDPWMSFRHEHGGDAVTLVDSLTRTVQVVKLSLRSITLRELLQAEVAMCPEVQFFLVRDCLNSQVVTPDEEVSGRCLWVEPSSTPVLSNVEVSEDQVMEDVQVAPKEVSPTLPWTLNAGSDDGLIPGPNQEGQRFSHDLGVVDPLALLNESQLCQVLLPHVDHLRTVVSLQAMDMPSSVRQQIIGNQNGTWSDDELTWHLTRILGESQKVGWVLMPIVLACDCVRRNGVQLVTQWLNSLSERPLAIVSAVAVGGHWVPFLWTWTSETLTAHSWDVAGNTPRCLNVLHDAVCKAVGARTFITHIDIRSFASASHCGLCTCRWLDHKIRGKMLPTTFDEVLYLHEIARHQFGEVLTQNLTVPRPWIWAAGLEIQSMTRLHELLAQHGVPLSQLEARANLVSSALGTVDLQNALTSANPWRSIKNLANRVKPPLLIVHPEELERVVSAKAGQGEVKGRRKGAKGKGKGKAVAPVPLDPVKLMIEEGSFVSEDDRVLSQIDSSALGPLAEGVALSTFPAIEPHLKAGVVLSSCSLAALVLNAEESQFRTSLEWSEVRVVLRCRANLEPMLVTAFLIQLGKVCVAPAKSKTDFVVPEVEAACVKVSVYKDGIDCSWPEFIQSPIRYILSVLASLIACHECANPGKCGRWHPSKDAVVADPILDIWRRQWISTTFKACEPGSASIFMLNLRYVKTLEESVLRSSGNRGVFVEPKTLDGKSGILEYQVLWMPRESLQELQRLQQCHVLIQGLARLGTRLGLRVPLKDAPELSRLIKPSSVYLSSGTRFDYEVGPLPFGMDRLSVTKLCESWKWQARPLHPLRSLNHALGTVWLIQSCHDPPAVVMKYQGGDIVINKVTKPDVTKVVGPVVGAASTRALCSFDDGGQTKPIDPWLKEDPWQSYASKAVPAHGGVGGGTQGVGPQLQQLEARIEQSILNKIQKADEDVDMDAKGVDGQVDSRLQDLELQIQSLHGRHAQLENRIEESVQKADAQIGQLQLQVSAQFDAQRGEMQCLFTSQMSQIEALLNKKARHE